MSDIHRRVFELNLIELEGRSLDPHQRGELHAHLAACPECRADLRLYQGLRLQADERWTVSPAPVSVGKVLQESQAHSRLRQAALPLRALLWAALAILGLALAQWVFTRVRPMPAILPVATTTPEPLTPAPPVTPTLSVDQAGKLPVEPLLQGDPSGQGIWSPDGKYFFITTLDRPVPGSDRRSTSLHFIKTGSGQDCPASETFLGGQGFQNYAWLDSEHVLYIDRRGRALLFTACQAGFLDLSDRFAEPSVRVALPLIPSEPAEGGPLLLQTASAYYLLDPITLQARLLAEPKPSPELGDSYAWIPSGRRLSVLQQIAGQAGRSRMVLLDLESGQVLRSLEIETSAEGTAPIVEWMGPERPFAWGFGTGGPLLVDLSIDPPRQVHVLPELLGLDLLYPDQINSMGVFYNPENGGFHVVVHVNLPDDNSIYLYHSENDSVEKLAGDRQMLMFLPGDQRMPLAPMQDAPTYQDSYDLFWVDKPDKPQAQLQISGHSPRNYPMLHIDLLPGSQRILVGSSQGVSMIGLPAGETLAFWRLVGAEDASSPSLNLAADGRTLFVTAHLNPSADGQDRGSLLYWIRLGESVASGSP